MTTVLKRDSMDATMDPAEKERKAVHLDQSASREKQSRFTDLPPSIRNNIYKHLLDTELVNVGKPNVSYSHSIRDGVIYFKASRPPFPVNSALFYVNRQISQEAINFFYTQNLFVRMTIFSSDARHAKAMLEDSGLLFSVANPELVAKSKQHAMDLDIVERSSSQKRASVMFPAQYLPRLINFMEQAGKTTKTWAPSRKLFIDILNVYDFALARLQGDLLEPWRTLTNLGSVEIDDKNLLDGYAEGLQQSMTAPSFSSSSWLSTLGRTKELGERASKEGHHEKAAQFYQSVIIALTYGYLTRPELLHSQPEEFSKSIQRLRWDCELSNGVALPRPFSANNESQNILSSASTPIETRKAYAKALLQAETSISHALSIAIDSPNPASNPWFQTLPPELIPPNKPNWFTKAEKADSWFACGVVHFALGEPLFAAGDLERACRLKELDGTGESEIERLFAEVRDAIDWNVKPGSGLKEAAKMARS